MFYLRLLVAALFASVRARRDLVLENLALRGISSPSTPGAVVDRSSVATTADSGHYWHAVGRAGEARS